MRWGDMEIEFTVGEPGSVRVTVRAMIDSQEGLDKVVAALGAARQLLPASAEDLAKEARDAA